MPPGLSVVIPSHNQPDLLRRCLDSVTRHAPAGTEVVVVDDASPGGIVSATAAGFPEVQVLRLAGQGGFCVAANAGVRQARHEIVELLNDDAEVTTGWAEAALSRFIDISVAAVAPLVLCGSPDRERDPRVDSAGDRYYFGGVAGKRGHRKTLGLEHLEPGPVFGASASCAFYRRDTFLRVGGFPESFGAYFEDVDLSFRLHWAGHKIYYEPASRVWHSVSSSYGRPNSQLLEKQSRNEERVFWRNLPRGMLLRALPPHLAVLAVKAWRRWRAGELLPFLRGRLSVLGEIGDLLRHRQWLRTWGVRPDPEGWRIERQWWGDRVDRR